MTDRPALGADKPAVDLQSTAAALRAQRRAIDLELARIHRQIQQANDAPRS